MCVCCHIMRERGWSEKEREIEKKVPLSAIQGLKFETSLDRQTQKQHH